MEAVFRVSISIAVMMIATMVCYAQNDNGVGIKVKSGNMAFKNEIAKEYPGYKKLSNRTVAGKSCTAFSFTNDSKTTTLAGWKGLLFFKEEPESSFLATSFSETVPANSFVIPSDYKLVENEDKE